MQLTTVKWNPEKFRRDWRKRKKYKIEIQLLWANSDPLGSIVRENRLWRGHVIVKISREFILYRKDCWARRWAHFPYPTLAAWNLNVGLTCCIMLCKCWMFSFQRIAEPGFGHTFACLSIMTPAFELTKYVRFLVPNYPVKRSGAAL